MFACILVMQFYFDSGLMPVIAGGINPVVSDHFELRTGNVTDQFDHEFEYGFFHCFLFARFMILVPVLDGFGVIVIGSDTALREKKLGEILSLPTPYAILRRVIP